MITFYNRQLLQEKYSIFSVNYLWLFLHSCQNRPRSARVSLCAACVWRNFPAHSELHSQPQKAAPQGRSLLNVCCFSLCLLDVHGQLWWLFRVVLANETTWSPRLCWYSCLPWGSTTAPEERDQINDLGPWHLASSLFTFPQTEEVVALTAELSWVQSQSCWLYPTGLYSLNDTDYLSGACLIWRRPWTFSWNWPNMTKSDHISHEEDHLRY